jgi:hypothetical protein
VTKNRGGVKSTSGPNGDQNGEIQHKSNSGVPPCGDRKLDGRVFAGNESCAELCSDRDRAQSEANPLREDQRDQKRDTGNRSSSGMRGHG